MKKAEFEAAVGMSRKWDAREAGREVARSAIEKLSRPPSFFLLFSTIHYEKHGGFQEFLNGVWDVLPKGTPLIGGTVAGFMNNYGCFTRGATSIAIESTDIKILSGIAHNTKRYPKKAIVCTYMGGKYSQRSIRLLESHNIPDYNDLKKSAKAMWALIERGKQLKK